MKKIFMSLLLIFIVYYSFCQTSSEYYNSGLRKYWSQNLTGAAEDFTKAIIADSTKAKYKTMRAQVYYMLGQFQNAYSDLSKFIFSGGDTINYNLNYLISAENTNFIENLNFWETQIDQSLIYLKDGQIGKAISFQPYLFKDENENSVISVLKGDSCVFTNNYEKAITYYTEALRTKAIEKNPKETNADTTWFSDEKPDYNKISKYSELIRINPIDTNAYYKRGIMYYDLKQYQKAIKDLTKVIEIDSTFPGIFKHRAYVYEDFGRYSNAIKDYSKGIEMDSLNSLKQKYGITIHPYNYYGRGYNFFITGQYDKSQVDFAMEIILLYRILQSLKDRKLTFSHYCQLISYCYLEKKDYKKAIAFFLKSLFFDYNSSNSHLGASISYYLSGDKVNARKYFGQANKLEPNLIYRVQKIEKSPWDYRFTNSTKSVLVKMFQEFK